MSITQDASKWNDQFLKNHTGVLKINLYLIWKKNMCILMGVSYCYFLKCMYYIHLKLGKTCPSFHLSFLHGQQSCFLLTFWIYNNCLLYLSSSRRIHQNLLLSNYNLVPSNEPFSRLLLSSSMQFLVAVTSFSISEMRILRLHILLRWYHIYCSVSD